jgi:hypothetical protein
MSKLCENNIELIVLSCFSIRNFGKYKREQQIFKNI